jgi:hypothetical protein
MALIDDFLALDGFDKPHIGAGIAPPIVNDAANEAILVKHMELCGCVPLSGVANEASTRAACVLGQQAADGGTLRACLNFRPMHQVAVGDASTDSVLKWLDDVPDGTILELDAEAWTDRERKELARLRSRGEALAAIVADYPELVVRDVQLDCDRYFIERLDGTERSPEEQEFYGRAIKEKLDAFVRIAHRLWPRARVFYARGGMSTAAPWLARQDGRAIEAFSPQWHGATQGRLEDNFRVTPRMTGDRNWLAAVSPGGGYPAPPGSPWTNAYVDTHHYMHHLGRWISHERRLKRAYLYPGPFDPAIGTDEYMQAMINYAEGYHSP